MLSVNKVIVVGNVGADPEIRAVGDGTVANLNVAATERWKDKHTGEQREATEWFRCSLWGFHARAVESLAVKRGDPVYIEGKLRTRKWQDKDGNDRYTTELICRGFDDKFISFAGRNESSQGQGSTQPEPEDAIPF